MWIAKDNTLQRDKRFTRAILSKYGNSITPSVYVISNTSILNALQDELKWCENRGVAVSVNFVKCGDYNFLIGINQ